jgi:hypothetical protein
MNIYGVRSTSELNCASNVTNGLIPEWPAVGLGLGIADMQGGAIFGGHTWGNIIGPTTYGVLVAFCCIIGDHLRCDVSHGVYCAIYMYHAPYKRLQGFSQPIACITQYETTLKCAIRLIPVTGSRSASRCLY